MFVLFTSVIPLLVLGLVTSQLATQTMRREAHRYNVILVKDQEKYLALQLQGVENLMASLSNSETLLAELENAAADPGGPAAQAVPKQMGVVLDRHANLHGGVAIELYADDGRYYSLSEWEDMSLDAPELARLKRLAANPGAVQWLGMSAYKADQAQRPTKFTAVQTLRKFDPATQIIRSLGLLVVTYEPDHFDDHFANLDWGQDSFFTIIDPQGNIVFHTDAQRPGTRLESNLVEQLIGDEGSFDVTYAGKESFLTYTRSHLTGWFVIGLIPAAALESGIAPLRIWILVVLLLSCITIVVSAALMTYQVVDPVRQVTERFTRAQQRLPGWNNPLQVKSQDEIGALVAGFNAFLESLAASERAEAALNESQERYYLAVRGANDGIWDWDLRTDKVYYSERWKEILGYRAEEIGSRPEDWLDRVHPADRQELLESLNAHLQAISPALENEHRLLIAQEEKY
ncbi:MAG TPA: PAS domain-containing protein, partial [Anaerolineales bacterium]|nr:PAS domain-containing protein [Anaerolineales bacterium]